MRRSGLVSTTAHLPCGPGGDQQRRRLGCNGRFDVELVGNVVDGEPVEAGIGIDPSADEGVEHIGWDQPAGDLAPYRLLLPLHRGRGGHRMPDAPFGVDQLVGQHTASGSSIETDVEHDQVTEFVALPDAAVGGDVAETELNLWSGA